MHTRILSATTIGISAHLVDVEVDLSFGLINFFIVGLPDVAIKESRQRITTALKNSGIKLPERKIIVNLAPANLKKEGTLFDLPIALGILQAAGYLRMNPEFLKETIIIGELALDGTIKPIQGALPITYDLLKHKKKRIILPACNAQEAGIVDGIEVIGAHTIVELVSYLRGEKNIAPTKTEYQSESPTNPTLDFADVKGQEHAKRALQIAAAGHHNILFFGPPGSGKTMLAQRVASIMQPLHLQEMIDTTKVYSICGKLHDTPLITQRPFRTPHHSISQAGLIGGGSFPKPGEASLAHNGILFLDELTEFKRDALESLRQALETKRIDLARAQQTVQYPAQFLLVAALNPCPCGYHGSTQKACICSFQQIQNYTKKLSGPLLDRIDIRLQIQAVDYQTAQSTKQTQTSQELWQGVRQAHTMQEKRFGNSKQKNSMMSAQEVEQYCVVTDPAQALLKKAFERLQLSMRGYHKILRVARTIADIAGSDMIDIPHIQEAILYRSTQIQQSSG